MITIHAYGKINLSLDVLGRLPSGYHAIETVMQQIELHDDVLVRFWPKKGSGTEIQISTNKPYLPKDQRNLAWQAAQLILDQGGRKPEGTLRIDIKKRLPVAAGLAGGSSNGAAVLHGVNQLFGLGYSLETLCQMGAALGADVPFCLMGQAAASPALVETFRGDPLAASCALGLGTGTELRPLKGPAAFIVLSKPPISVSTKEVYQGLDLVQIHVHPDTGEMLQAIAGEDPAVLAKNMVNVLENFTMKRYDKVVYTKNKMQELSSPDPVLMSGSGPTVFAFLNSEEKAQAVYREMKKQNRETFLTRTIP